VAAKSRRGGYKPKLLTEVDGVPRPEMIGLEKKRGEELLATEAISTLEKRTT